MTYIAAKADGRVSSEEIAGAGDLPLPVLSKILQELTRKGLLESQRGPGGGFRLARSAELITLRDIVAVIDGLDHFLRCVAGLSVCSDEAPCPLHTMWMGMRAQILASLETTTLAQMARTFQEKNQGALGQQISQGS